MVFITHNGKSFNTDKPISPEIMQRTDIDLVDKQKLIFIKRQERDRIIDHELHEVVGQIRGKQIRADRTGHIATDLDHLQHQRSLLLEALRENK